MKKMITLALILCAITGFGQISSAKKLLLSSTENPAYTNSIYWVIVNESSDAGNTASPAYYSEGSGGPWMLTGKPLLSSNPSVFYKQTLTASSPAVPAVGDLVTLSLGSGLQMNPSNGHKLRYLISSTEYLSSQYLTLISNSTVIPFYYNGTSYVGDFYFNINNAVSNYIYIIYDFRNN